MDNFVEKYNLPRLNMEETENLNRPIISNEIEAEIKKLVLDFINFFYCFILLNFIYFISDLYYVPSSADFRPHFFFFFQF